MRLGGHLLKDKKKRSPHPRLPGVRQSDETANVFLHPNQGPESAADETKPWPGGIVGRGTGTFWPVAAGRGGRVTGHLGASGLPWGNSVSRGGALRVQMIQV